MNEKRDLVREVCLNALGAYEALRLCGADKELPGIGRCEERVRELLKLLEVPSWPSKK